ncbi:hypothetical protein FDENT_5033 [Fusarium denticulatum]|uniref:Uncharacterized protein n=1 Tax=Fusarium denticulatum TaxID=48507 RepID=A0A8H5UL12_9HYPO|nr:hypothetical protein FDENT_5033 [Fusarium denticulatum]
MPSLSIIILSPRLRKPFPSPGKVSKILWSSFPKAQDAVPQIQGILFTALDELSGPLRGLSGVQKGFSCENDQQRHSQERIRGVGFYVHSSLRTDQWRVRSYPGDNEDIFATLELKTPSGLLAIHNVYNHNN